MEEKRHAYLIVVHKNPKQVNLLLELLAHPLNDIFVHIDRKSSIKEQDINCSGNVKVYKEIAVYWSHYTLTEVELLLLDKALNYADEHQFEYEYLHLISGMDLPLKSQDYIHNFFDGNKGKEFVEYQIPGRFADKAYYSRSRYYHILSKHYRHNGFAGRILSYIAIGLEYAFMGLQMVCGVNRIPKDMNFARGSQWFSITTGLARYILSRKDWIRKHYVMTRASDESFLAMLVHNSPFRESLYVQTFDGDMHANMRFIDWSRGEPYVFRDCDYNELMSSDLLFARKFDLAVDDKVIERIYKKLLPE